MKRYVVQYTQGARDDLADIHGYVAEISSSETTANKIVEQIISKCSSLATFPKSSVVKLRLKDKEFRLTHCRLYAIAYTVSDADGTVDIHAIKYARRDLRKLL